MIRVAAVTLLVAVAAGTTGCNATKRELKVDFASTATLAQREAALKTCTGSAPRTTPEPMTTAAATLPSVRFRIDHADDRDIAHLEACLAKQAGVLGFEDSNDSM